MNIFGTREKEGGPLVLGGQIKARRSRSFVDQKPPPRFELSRFCDHNIGTELAVGGGR